MFNQGFVAVTFDLERTLAQVTLQEAFGVIGLFSNLFNVL